MFHGTLESRARPNPLAGEPLGPLNRWRVWRRSMSVEDRQAADGSELLPDADVLREQVRAKYREVATAPGARYHFHTGRALAALLGYESAVVDALPERAVESFAGVGNPFSLRPL